jgi:hypothetical protein
MKAISLTKWSPDGYDDRYMMYRFRSRNNAYANEILLVSEAKLLDNDGKAHAYLNPTTDGAEANEMLERASRRLNFYFNKLVEVQPHK